MKLFGILLLAVAITGQQTARPVSKINSFATTTSGRGPQVNAEQLVSPILFVSSYNVSYLLFCFSKTQIL